MRAVFGRCGCVLVTAVALAPGLRAQKGPAPADVLTSAGDYLGRYSEKIAGIAASEDSLQFDTTAGRMNTTKRVTAVRAEHAGRRRYEQHGRR